MGLERPFSVQTLVNLCMKRASGAGINKGDTSLLAHIDFLKADPVNEPLDPEVFLHFFSFQLSF